MTFQIESMSKAYVLTRRSVKINLFRSKYFKVACCTKTKLSISVNLSVFGAAFNVGKFFSRGRRLDQSNMKHFRNMLLLIVIIVNIVVKALT